LNSRPLSYNTGDEPITPSHLIVGHRVLSLPDHLDHVCDLEDDEYTLDHNRATRRIKHLNNVLNHFCRRWHTEYLGDLREIHANTARRSHHKQDSHISEGEVVIVKDDHLPRGQWKLGVVQEVMPGRDGQVRAAVVKLASSGPRAPILRRPIQLLYPLEIRCKSSVRQPAVRSAPESVSPTSEPCEPVSQSPTVEEQSRPRRAAARRVDEVRRKWIAELEHTD